MTQPRETLRIDKWLWHARFFKSRALAARVAAGGHCRVNGVHVAKASFAVAVGDVLTFPQGGRVRVVEVVALGLRRGPAPEAQGLYLDHSPPIPPRVTPAPGAERSGRPTKKDRRAIERHMRGENEP